jgi:hypothetical protein
LKNAAGQVEDRETEAGPDIEQPGHKPRINGTEQEFGERCARAKQHGRCESKQDTGLHGLAVWHVSGHASFAENVNGMDDRVGAGSTA